MGVGAVAAAWCQRQFSRTREVFAFLVVVKGFGNCMWLLLEWDLGTAIRHHQLNWRGLVCRQRLRPVYPVRYEKDGAAFSLRVIDLGSDPNRKSVSEQLMLEDKRAYFL